jgi:hypothetical protein
MPMLRWGSSAGIIRELRIPGDLFGVQHSTRRGVRPNGPIAAGLQLADGGHFG